MKSLLAFTLGGLLLVGCASAPQTPSAEHLRSLDTGLDHVAAVMAFDMSGAKVFMAAPELTYLKRRPSASRGVLKPKDYELTAKQADKLYQLTQEILAAKLLGPRQSTLVTDAAEADYTLQLTFEELALAAPLDPKPGIYRVYAEYAAHTTLKGALYDRAGNLVVEFNDRRDVGDRQLGGIQGEQDLFNRITFWRDMRIDLRRAFASLDQALKQA